ncbi:hypothetical protein ElyMa_004947300 [Elysia marginata]|uniref:Uncharacterized protein n=1 Tax=Elysia marginata TaxID=1093978 RepID=A0AAV4J270_9GAST|nr:hypothetical protein ElyMa_004947300 [Elysia marginata]
MLATRRGSCWHLAPTKHAVRCGSYIRTLRSYLYTLLLRKTDEPNSLPVLSPPPMAHLFIHGVDAAFHLRLAAGDNITTSSTLLTSSALFSVQIFPQNTDSPLIFAANAYCLSTIFLFSYEKPSLPSLWQVWDFPFRTNFQTASAIP